MVPYKKMHLIVEAFSNMPDRELIVIGTGPQFSRCKALAGPNVKLLGYQPHSTLLWHLQRARAFIFAAEEDFGIAPIEAQACGTPVLAFGKGGATETIVDGVTGLLFHEQSSLAIQRVVREFESIEHSFDPEIIRANAMRFSTERFRNEFTHYVHAKWREHKKYIAVPKPVLASASNEPAYSQVDHEREDATL
jgi:glycosyltransferase involved in cell wall biosynthesis